jgi:phosphatidylglycerophosphatase A
MKNEMKFKTAQLLVTSFGLGLLPKAPGTWGSLAGVACGYFTFQMPLWATLAGIFILYGIGTWGIIVYHSSALTPSKKGIDRPEIVIDEVIGQWITCLALHSSLLNWNSPVAWALSFVFFRIFDILKPWPISKIDRWSKTKTGITAAQGVIWDDLIAGLLGFLSVLGTYHSL